MALSSATQHAMHPEFGRKWGTECLNTRFPLPTLLCAGYSVKLIYFFYIFVQQKIPARTNILNVLLICSLIIRLVNLFPKQTCYSVSLPATVLTVSSHSSVLLTKRVSNRYFYENYIIVIIYI